MSTPAGIVQVYLIVDINQKAEHRNSRPAERGAYSTPKLKVFGPVGRLTQAGSGNRAERVMDMGMGIGMGMGMGADMRRL
jgi:hypothetical protein